MAAQIDGNTILSSMVNKGHLYRWEQPLVVARNGRGRDVTVGYPKLHWGFNWLSDAEWDWWVTTVLAGEQDALVTGTTELYNHEKVLTDIDQCIVHAPVYETIQNGIYRNVYVLIDQIVVAP